MTYKLRFQELALAEWKKLDATTRERFKKKLVERLEEPRVPIAALSGMRNCYKIKLRDLGYRLIYQVEEEIVFVSVIAIGKRDKNKVYKSAKSRLVVKK
jgi:mRNA interferase RelE/StbE